MKATAPTVSAAEQAAATLLNSTEAVAEVVDLVKTMPGIRPDTGTQHFLEAVAWLHTVFAGKKTDVEAVAKHLKEAGIPEHVVFAAKAVSGEDWMPMSFYYRHLDGSFELVKVVKVCSHVVKLRHAKPGYHRSETANYVVPLTFEMGDPWKTWLNEKLTDAAA